MSTTTYLVRYRGVSHICRPGAVEWRDTNETEGRLRLGRFGRDDGGFVCHDGEADDARALEDDEPESPELVRMRARVAELSATLRQLKSELTP